MKPTDNDSAGIGTVFPRMRYSRPVASPVRTAVGPLPARGMWRTGGGLEPGAAGPVLGLEGEAGVMTG